MAEHLASLASVREETKHDLNSERLLSLLKGMMVLTTCAIAVLLGNSMLTAQATFSSNEDHVERTRPSSLRRAPANHEAFAPFWTLEPGWHTDLELRNNLAAEDLEVTPVLWTFDGTELQLPAVQIKPDRIEKIDLQAAVDKLHYRITTYGSVAFKYKSISAGNLYAAAFIQRLGHPISFHVDAFPLLDSSLVAESWEGVWWLPRPGADGLVAVSNLSSQTLSGHEIFSSDGGERKMEALSLGPHETRLTSIRDFVQRAGFKSLQGGLKIETNGGGSAIAVSEFLFDEQAGFSALMKVFDRNSLAEMETQRLRAPLLGLWHPDAMLHYPDGTKLRPVVFVRNASPNQIIATFNLHWKSASQTGATRAVPLSINPEETKVLDLSVFKQYGLPSNANWANVEMSYFGRPGDLVPVAASYDSTGRHGLQSPFSSALSFMFKGGMWHSDAQHDSLITVGNAGTKSARVAMTLFYDKDESYELPERSLATGEQMWIDVGQLIRNQPPDRNGKTIAPDTMSGSYEIRDLNDSQIGYLYEGKMTTDETFGHATYGCAPCCGYDGTYMTPDPMNAFIGDTGYSYTIWATNDCTGNDVARGGGYNWVSSNTSVATVNTYGTMSCVGVGSANVSSLINLRIPGVNNCPAHTFSQAAGMNVFPTVSISGPTNIPMLKAGAQGSNSITLTANVRPVGGTYSWSAVSGAGNISILSPTSQSTGIQSVAVGTYTVQVKYTYNGKPSTATSVGRVQQPGSLGVISNDTPAYACTNLPGSYNTLERLIQYEVLDTANPPQPIPAANMTATETLTLTSNGCNVPPPTPTVNAKTGGNGYFPTPDQIAMCAQKCLPADANGNPTGTCTSAMSQVWTVNGYAVQSRSINFTCPGPPTGVP